MHIPKNEHIARLKNIKTRICEKHPQLSGFFIFSRINIYYFTGTPANGVLYVPMNGEPLLFVRKGFEKRSRNARLNIFTATRLMRKSKPFVRT